METIPDIIRGFRATDGEVLRIAGVEAEPFAAVDPRHLRVEAAAGASARIVATGVTKLHTPQNATVVITHYQRLLDYIVPDVVHVLYKGRIIHSGDKSLALRLEKEGYDWLINEYDK